MIQFFVPGTPAPQGSKRAFQHKTTGRIIQVEQSGRVKPWRADIRAMAEDVVAHEPRSHLWEQDVAATLSFYMPRPKAHYGTGRNAGVLKDSAPSYPAGKNIGDLDKLCRAVLDALSGVIYADDCQVVSIDAQRLYADDGRPGVMVQLEEAL